MTTTIRKKKSLGQNFLTDTSVADKIVRCAGLKADDVVLEVGPGDGILTGRLLDTNAHVYALEIDRALIPILKKQYGSRKNFTLLHTDIRRFNLPEFFTQQAITTYSVVANLPYYITSSIIRLFLESTHQPTEMVIMVQKEVAQRICATPGALSVLAIAVQFYGKPEELFAVPAMAFSPVPAVDSVVLRISQITRTLPREEEKQFFRVVRAGFSARRKTLVNNLAHSFRIAKEEVVQILQKQDIAPTVRAQELSIAQWKDLAQELADKKYPHDDHAV